MVEQLEPDAGTGDRTLVKLSARFLLLSMKAAREAWADAGLERADGRLDPDRVAVAVGSAFGGVDFLEAQQARMRKRHDLSVSPFLVPGLLINQAAGQIAQHLGLYGPSMAPTNACASGGHAIIMGAMFLKAGDADLALCGAGESAFTPAIVNGFSTMKALLGASPGDRSEADPAQASRPFSVDRAGFVMSEGAAMLVLATESAVRRLGLTPQAELLGYAMNSDGYHMAMPSQERITRCVTTALERAGLPPDVDRLLQRPRHQHDPERPGRDRRAQGRLRRPRADAARQLDQGRPRPRPGRRRRHRGRRLRPGPPRPDHPPTINHLPDPELDLDYVPGEARPARLQTVMSSSFGFGGTNNVLIFGRASDEW